MNISNFLWRAFFLLTFFFPFFLKAQEEDFNREKMFSLELNELVKIKVPEVLSGGFFLQSAARTTGNVTVISDQQLNIAPATQLRDIYDQYIPGFVVGENEVNGTLIGSRGIHLDNNAKTLFIFDGQPINNRLFGYAGSLEWPFFRDIRQIEVITGPGSIQHGSGAINGFVFLEPKNGTDNQGGFGSLTYGVREELAQVETGYGTVFSPGHDLFLYGGWLHAHGFEPYHYGQQRTDPADLRTGVGQEKWVAGYGDPTFKVGAYYRNFNFKTNFYFINNNPQGTAHPDWATPENQLRPDSFRPQRQMIFSPRYEAQVGEKSSIEFRLNGMLADQLRENYFPLVRIPYNTYGQRESHLEGRVAFRTTAYRGHSFAFGGLIGGRKFDDKKAFFGENPEAGAGLDSHWLEYGLYTEDVWSITPQLTASAGLRYDLVDYKEMRSSDPSSTLVARESPFDQNKITPRFAVSYEFSPVTTVKASYQQGFRYPDADEFGEWSLVNARLKEFGFSNRLKSLQPEIVDSTEIGINHQWKEQGIKVTGNAYYNTYQNLIQYTCHGAETLGGPQVVEAFDRKYDSEYYRCSQYNAHGNINSFGGELTASWAPQDDVLFGVSYGYSTPRGISSRNDPYGDTLDDVRDQWRHYPEHIFKASVTKFLLHHKIIAHVNVIHSSPIYDGAAVDGTYPWSDPRTEVNASLTYRFLRNFSLKFFTKNLFDERDPKPSLRTNQPWRGNRGNAQGTYYLSLNYEF